MDQILIAFGATIYAFVFVYVGTRLAGMAWYEAKLQYQQNLWNGISKTTKETV